MTSYSTVSVKKLMRQAVRDLRSSKHDSAVDITSEIIARENNHAAAHAVQFSALFKSKRFEQARRIGTIAAELNPTSVFILNNQACLQLEAKQPAAASGLLKSLIDQYGERGQWLYNLALAQRMVGNFDYAITTFSRTLDFDEQHDRAAFQLADCLTLVGNHEQASRVFAYVRLLRDNHAPSHCNYIHHAVVNNTISRQDLDLEFALWQNRFIPSDKRYDINPIGNLKQLNIGFLLGKLPANWARALVAPVINGLGSGADSITVYWHDEQLDPELFDDTINIVHSAGFTDADFARRVRADHIEVMVDVCGMRIGARQRALGLQVAGKQFGWLAHEGQYATELVELLDDKLMHYAADLSNNQNLIDIGNRTLLAIGCQRGVSQAVLGVWASIMRKLPDWRLHLASDNQLANKHLKTRFRGEGIDDTRLSFGGNVSIDAQTIALDNFTENSPAATISVLQRGATVVGMLGEHFPAQHTARILKQCGRENWLCDSPYSYEDMAVKLANTKHRNGIGSADFEASGLADIDGFTRRFRQALAE